MYDFNVFSKLELLLNRCLCLTYDVFVCVNIVEFIHMLEGIIFSTVTSLYCN
jgi:hypothetical protein